MQIFEDNKYSGYFMPDGSPVFTQEYIQALRDEDMKHPGTLRVFIAQKGAQEKMLATNVDILICGGSRGGSKSFSMLMQSLYDITASGFTALLLRKETKDLDSLINDSYKL